MAGFSWLWVLVAACAGNVAAHILCFRTFPATGLYLTQLAGLAAGLAILAVGLWHVVDGSIPRDLAELCIYVCFCYSYFHFNNMGETARRVRLVIELSRAPQGLSRGELLARYGAAEIIERRLGRLLGSGQIQERGARFVLGNRSVFAMARVVGLFKRVLNVPDPV